MVYSELSGRFGWKVGSKWSFLFSNVGRPAPIMILELPTTRFSVPEYPNPPSFHPLTISNNIIINFVGIDKQHKKRKVSVSLTYDFYGSEVHTPWKLVLCTDTTSNNSPAQTTSASSSTSTLKTNSTTTQPCLIQQHMLFLHNATTMDVPITTLGKILTVVARNNSVLLTGKYRMERSGATSRN
jgi:hypothetical protein